MTNLLGCSAQFTNKVLKHYFLYWASFSFSGEIYCLDVEPNSGALTQCNTTNSVGGVISGLTQSHNGQFLYAGIFLGTKEIKMYTVNSTTGALTLASSTSTSNQTIMGLNVDLASRGLYALTPTSLIYYSIDPNGFTLNLEVTNTGGSNSGGNSPILTHPNGRLVYSKNGNALDLYLLSASSYLPSYAGTQIPSGIRMYIHPSGNFMMVRNANDLSSYWIDQNTGGLSNPQTVLTTTPSGVGFANNGKTLLVLDGTSLYAYTFDINTGLIQNPPTSHIASTASQIQTLNNPSNDESLILLEGGTSPGTIESVRLDHASGMLSKSGYSVSISAGFGAEIQLVTTTQKIK